MDAEAGSFTAAPDESAACPAYPWPQDGAQGGRKVFMQSDCSACHGMLPYAGLREAGPAPGEAGPKVAEIVVVVNEEQPAFNSGVYKPLVTTTMPQEGLRRNNLNTADGLDKKMTLPAPVWLQFLKPYMAAAHHAA